MEMNESYINQIVQSVIKNLENAEPTGDRKLKGVFTNMSDALAAVQEAYLFYKSYSVEQREKMISNIRKLTLQEAEIMAKMGVEETGMGRVSDKIIKHQLVANIG